MSSMTLTVQIEIGYLQVAYFIETAYDNMSDWCTFDEVHMPEEPDWSWDVNDKWKDYTSICAALCGGHVILRDHYGDGDKYPRNKQYRLDMDHIKAGFEVMAKEYPKSYSNFIDDAYDSTDANTFLQCCILGGAPYG